MTTTDEDEEFRGNYVSEVKGYELLFAVISPHTIPLLTSARVMLEMVSGTNPGAIPDLHRVEGDYDTLDSMLDFIGEYVDERVTTLYPVTDTWIGMHAMSGRLMNGYLHMAVEEWPFIGQFALTFHVRDSDPDDRLYQHLVGQGANFLAITDELDCFEEPRDCIVFATVLDNALINISSKRHMITGKPHLKVIVSNDI